MATPSSVTVLIATLSVLRHTILYLPARVCVTWTVGLRVFNGQKGPDLTHFYMMHSTLFIESILDVVLEHILAPHNNVIKLRDWGDGSVVKALAERV